MTFFSHVSRDFSWFFICWVILDYILNILNVTLWDSGSFLSPMDNAGIFLLADNWPKWVRLQVLLVVVSALVLLSKALLCYSDMSCAAPRGGQSGVWIEVCALAMVFRVQSMLRGKPRRSERNFIGLYSKMSLFILSLVLQSALGSPLSALGQKTGAFVTVSSVHFLWGHPHLVQVGGELEERKKKQHQGFVLPFLRFQLLQSQKKFPLPQSFRSLSRSLLQDCWGIRE